MNTLGYTTMKALAHVTLGTVLGLFIVLPIHLMAVSTLEENTSTKNVSLEVVRDGLRLKVTGNDTMEALTSLVQIESYLETQRSKERSYPSIPDSEM